MKRLLSFLLALMLCISLFGCDSTDEVKTDAENKTQETTLPEQPQESEPTETELEETIPEETEPAITEPTETEPAETTPAAAGSTPLLYKVTDEDGDVVWLFGSIHAGWEEYYPLPDYVLDAFESSDALAVEFDVVAFEKDYSAMVEALTAMVYMDGTKISDHIPEDLYDRAVAILKENNSYNSLLDMYYPVMWYSTIETFMIPFAGADVELGIDKYMINLAYDSDKPVLDIESPELQYGMLAGFSDELQATLLYSSVVNYEEQSKYVAELIQLMTAWMEGDEEMLRELSSMEIETENPEEMALMEEYSYAMLEGRNIGMTEFAVDALEDGEEIFICVGSAHIVGETGMVDLLRELGYTVEAVR